MQTRQTIMQGTKILTGSLAKEVEENDLFSTLFDSLTPGNYLHYNVRVEVRNKDTGPWITVHEGLESKLLLMKMLEFTKLKYVILPSDIAVSSPSHIRFPNAFTRLMEFKLQLPVQKRENTHNILLYNHIIQLLQNKNVGWIVYQQNGAYNEYYQQMKKKKPQLTRLELFQLANSIEISLTEPWVSEAFWQEVISNIFEFTSMLKKYTENLKTTNDNMKRIHKSGNPVREPSSNCNIHLISKNDEEIDERYFELDSDLKNNELFDFVDLDQYAPNDPIKKHNFIRDIQLSVPAGLYRYPHGNYLGTLNFIWRAPDIEEASEYYKTLKAQMITRINDIIPIYCTRQMKKNYSLVRHLSKSVLRMLYHDLTGDASLANDQIGKEIEERLCLMISLEDPSIIVDLRTNNGFKGLKFDIFWDELDGYFNEHNNTVVNERRTNTILYIPYAISIRELRNKIITRLNTKYQGPPLPYDYEHEFSIKYQDYACFISADNKHKVPIREDVPISTGVRNKKTLALAEGEISASDHNFTKLSLTPSVTLFIDIPNNISESFYDRKVYVCYKDTVFQQSSALRHSTEFFNLVKHQYQNRPFPTILSLYTDGGPDHKCTFGSVQVALICLFLAGDFDMLIAVRTAPHYSWCNPAERL
ncbi:hypothetical protein GLOIN_2v1788492 [Rhizophagus irregularis DAOM 181602=DAOM 197198]|uniref:Uncharacterized protein n=1 Tax=Rhizophagus irregularis (strain DAOM 181602 / DAOM 197198 / MUCL 43194) TaxID=747089 RepID=A0A2P4P3M4_RHIID|nr:hypothetical protein GLOIN_2v1788492 [Rhizophagus irregularis DAOM 181602=DAOM 197198]POG59970.1 hypothetical protein GLOIN_2v1788492 [Rhizophagus irregularis DAOM 181602=DAOM 197198]|eukprot:XP_025166836.1 hypothetical protein GLOIN_2v1788492 [Rhizophagus irregularis DAOM 181602=DAOM 197198]